jgi:hypothetical protein
MRIPSLKAAIEKTRKMQGQQKKEEQKKEAPKTEKKEICEERTFATSIFTFLTSYPSGEIYALYDSFILDSASTVHIYNNPERFQSLQQAGKDEYLIAGTSRVPIEGYGIVEIAL